MTPFAPDLLLLAISLEFIWVYGEQSPSVSFLIISQHGLLFSSPPPGRTLFLMESLILGGCWLSRLLLTKSLIIYKDIVNFRIVSNLDKIKIRFDSFNRELFNFEGVKFFGTCLPFKTCPRNYECSIELSNSFSNHFMTLLIVYR